MLVSAGMSSLLNIKPIAILSIPDLFDTKLKISNNKY